MTLSSNLGIASLALWIVSTFLLFRVNASPYPIITLAVLSIVFALLAANRGRKWWLLIPLAIVAEAILLFILASEAS
jgi:hypothetical protein